VADHAANKGWFFGAFMDNPLLRSNLVEVAWQTLDEVSLRLIRHTSTPSALGSTS
jgi:hypothetical protein